MTRYFLTAWCDRPFYAQCEVEANSPEEALAKARESIHDAPAEECDGSYNWDEWRVDTDETVGVLLHLDEPARLRTAARKLLAALQAIVEEADNISYHTPHLATNFWDDARAAIAEATDGHPAPDTLTSALLNVLRAVLPYAEAELASLQEAHKRDGGLESEVAACDAAIDEASQLVSQIEAEGV
ncbi:MAG: hypothetical protein U0800_12645 [Isosphaeraceae bacterium]